VVARGVVHHEVGDHADPARVGGLDQLGGRRRRPVVGVDLVEVGDVVAAVAQRRLVERQQPDAVDPEPLQVVELLGQAAEVAGAVAVGVEEAADVDLVEDRTLEPQRVGLEPLARLPGAGRRLVGPVRGGAQADQAQLRAASGRQGQPAGSPRTPPSTGTTSRLDLEDVRLAHPGLESDVVAPDPPLEALVVEQVVDVKPAADPRWRGRPPGPPAGLNGSMLTTVRSRVGARSAWRRRSARRSRCPGR
jgi:hypothetical protein